jgi:hypothetical protein
MFFLATRAVRSRRGQLVSCFNERARRRWGWSGWYFWGHRKEDKEAPDALAPATALIAAVFCSSIIIFVFIAALVHFVK